MITLVSRKEALENEVFASFISMWQERFDPRIDPYMTIPGVYYDHNIDKSRFFTQEEIDKIHQEEVAEFEKLRDDIIPVELDFKDSLIFNLDEENIFLYAQELGETLSQFAQLVDSEITFLLDYSIPWQYQRNEYFPVQHALNYLNNQDVHENYVGGLRASGDALAELTTNLFWIIRCNAGLPYCWFSTRTAPFVGHICKYGNIHLECYSEKIKKELDQIASTLGWIKINDCFQVFQDSNGITGRETIV